MVLTFPDRPWHMVAHLSLSVPNMPIQTTRVLPPIETQTSPHQATRSTPQECVLKFVSHCNKTTCRIRVLTFLDSSMHTELAHVRKPQDHKAQHCDDNGADPLADTADTASIYGSINTKLTMRIGNPCRLLMTLNTAR